MNLEKEKTIRLKSIKMTEDYSSNFGDSIMPIIDMKVRMEGAFIEHRHYSI